MMEKPGKKDKVPQRLNAAQWRAILAHQPLLFEVTSNSMRPAFCPKEHVLIRPLETGEPKPGQILAYFQGILITHRFLGNGICRGDNALAQDPPIGPEDMVGIVAAVQRDEKLVPLGRRMPLRTRIRRLLIRWRRRSIFIAKGGAGE